MTTELSTALIPLLQASCPKGCGGYGGTFSAFISPQAAEQAGGIDFLRTALVQAALSLDWKPDTTGEATMHGAIGVRATDTRKIPAPYDTAVEAHRQRQLREAVEAVDAGRLVPEPNQYTHNENFMNVLIATGLL
ncbi:hypothetical protein [Streptacidiphilus sp. EB103A]|uniref:hypothetical protein n=1 Tax=Streptacidiphilus sp. EB103A TaxID=3156275 RepID=UPI00351397E7